MNHVQNPKKDDLKKSKKNRPTSLNKEKEIRLIPWYIFFIKICGNHERHKWWDDTCDDVPAGDINIYK